MAMGNNQKLENLRAFILDLEYERKKLELENDAAFQFAVERGTKDFIVKYCAFLDEAEPRNEKEPPTEGRAIGLSELERMRAYLQQLVNIPVQIARQVAQCSDQTLNDCRRVAEIAPVAAMAPTDHYRFQLPLAMYFRETGGLSDEVVTLWGQATLSFQRRAQGLRLMLQSQPDNWGLIVSIGEDNVISLCQDQIVETILCETEQLDNLKIGIVPFRQATP